LDGIVNSFWRSRDKDGFGILPSPYPYFFAIHLCASFVGAHYFAFHNPWAQVLVDRSSFSGESVYDTVQATLAYRDVKHIVEQLFQAHK